VLLVNAILDYLIDETLPIKYKPKHLERGDTRKKMEGLMSKKTKKPPKTMNHKGNIKFMNPFQS
jgi:hypothetical protein